MIPTTITTDDSIGIIYTTVIQFAYVMEGDEENYTCTVTTDKESAESTFDLEIIRKLNIELIHTLNFIHNYVIHNYVTQHKFSYFSL